MKYLRTYPEKCVGCHTCENVCSQLFFKNENADLSCVRITEKDNSFDINVCNQCGKCVTVCPPMALSVNAQGVVMLNKSKCIGCMACVAICPTQSMRFQKNKLIPFKCIACGSCATKCPVKALEIVMEG